MSIQTKKLGQLEYLAAEGISAPHCFTTKKGGVSTGVMAGLNIAIKDGETKENVRKNLEILGNAIGFGIDDLVLTRQVHSDIVRVVNRDDCNGYIHRDYPECDALVTKTAGVALMIFTADCTPLLFHDPVTGAVGAAHAGWRGTAAAIGAKVVETMVREFGSNPGDIRAAIGPNVGMCHFETDRDVPDAMIAAFGSAVEPWIEKRGGKYFLDLKQINAHILRRCGVTHIEISDACTMCDPARFWSHRVTRGQRGSQGAVIVCREGCR